MIRTLSTKPPNSKRTTAGDARFAAQKLAFGPLVFHATLALRDLGILRALMAAGEAGATSGEVAEQLDLSPYAVTVLLESGLGADLVELNERRFSLSKVGYFVLHDEMTRVNLNFVRDICYQGAADLITALKELRPAGLHHLGDWENIYQGIDELEEPARSSWFEFDHYYSSSAFPDALPLVFTDPVDRLLDVGGNTGKWAVMCAEHQPTLEVTVLDAAPQIRQVEQRAAASGVEGRVAGVVTDLLDHSQAFPGGFDAVWMSQVLSCFSEQDIVGIVQRAVRALRPGGRVYVLETFWDRQKYEGARYNLQQASLYFASIANGVSRIYDFATVRECLTQAGLVVDAIEDGLGVSHTLLRCSVR